MKNQTFKIALALVAILTLLWPTFVVRAESGSGSIKLGYTFNDEEGSLAVNQETYNTYEGLGVSFNDWRCLFDNGMALKADVTNLTLNNRHLSASLAKPGSFSLSMTNSQYRRTYDFNGSRFTRRNMTGIQALVQPTRSLKLFGGYGVTLKNGSNLTVYSPISDSIVLKTDYSNSSYNVGGQITGKRGFIRADYRHFAFDDKTTANIDRAANNLMLTASAPLPRYDWIVVSGGYNYRLDKITGSSTELQTDQGWGGTKLYFPHNFVADYRIVYAISKHVSPGLTTDNALHTGSISKNWPRYGGLRVGYEYRSSDNYVQKTSSSGYLVNGWLHPAERWNFSAQVATRNRKVDEGTTLVGDEDVTRHMIKAAYRDMAWGTISSQWQGRVRTDDDINTKVSYNNLTSALTLNREKLGWLTAAYSYYAGSFENRSDQTSFEFADYVVTGSIHPRSYRRVTVDFGAVYYRSKRDNDIEKFNLNFGAAYAFPSNYHLEIRYNVWNYDDYLVRENYYTANIVEVNLIKDLTF